MKQARQHKLRLFITVMVIGLCAVPIAAQTTGFTYQGKLTEAGTPATGTYDMQFKLFDTAGVGTGTQQGATLTNPTVQVTNGIFAMNLDFGTNVFTGAGRFLEIGVRPAAGNTNPYTILAPRQPITASPYAIQTVNAQQLGGLPASRYVATDANGNVNIGPGCCGLARLSVAASGFGIMHADGEAAIISYLQPSGAALFGTLNSHPLSLVTGFNPRMTLDTSGNVGIGTIAPLTKLDVRGDLTLDPGANPTLYTSVASTEQNRYLHLINSPSAPSASGLKAGGILVADDYGYGLPTKNDLIVKGFVGIGLGASVAPANPLHVAGNIRIGTGSTGCVLDADGTVIAGTCSSDVRLKRHIVPFAHLLDKVTQLQAVHFYWRAEEFKERHFGTRPSFGLIAQEVEKVLPELVTEDEQGYKAVNYSKLPLLMLQAIKELKVENDALKQRFSEQQASADLQQQQSRQLKKQQTQIERQQRAIDELLQAVKALQSSTHNQRRK
jgi:hypothetical protein